MAEDRAQAISRGKLEPLGLMSERSFQGEGALRVRRGTCRDKSCLHDCRFSTWAVRQEDAFLSFCVWLKSNGPNSPPWLAGQTWGREFKIQRVWKDS